MQTQNQIVENAKTLANSHVQVRTFHYGFWTDLQASGTVQYPCVLMTPAGAEHQRSGTTYRFTFTISDVMLPDRSNESEVMSDLHLVATDIIAQLQHHDYDWYIGENPVVIEQWYEHGVNYCGSVSFDIAFTLQTPSDRCRIPWRSSAPQANSGVGTQVTIRNALTGATITTVPCGSYYEVEVLTEVADDPDNNTTTIIDPL